ncbi:MAG: PKD domain-containing protein [Euryarchaeota archaeon]|nr:PKD domain-containing protein [Euryarchaeota archaeon]
MGARGLLAVLAVLALVPWGAEGALPVDPGGNIVVTTDTAVGNETLAPAGHLLIHDGATLTMNDCRLIMKPSTYIVIGGALVMHNVTITANESGPVLSMLCDGRLVMDNCTVSDFRYWTFGTRSYDCSITDCYFNISGVGIEIYNGTPIIRNNTFLVGLYKYDSMPLIYSRNAAPVIEENIFDGRIGRYDGVFVRYPDSPVIANNTFVNCSIGLSYNYIHQHDGNGTVSPPPGEPALVRDNAFVQCYCGMLTTDSPMGHGDGRAGPQSRAAGPVPPALLSIDNRFEWNEAGVSILGESPTVIEGCEFTQNTGGMRLNQAYWARLANSTFTNNTVGLSSSSGSLTLSGCVFDRNDRALDCRDTVSTVENSTFHGGLDTSVSMSRFTATGSYVANSTFTGGDSIALRLEGAAVVFNNTFRDCPFGIYRAVRLYGQGHGRDIGQGPPAESDMATIAGNRFENNTRGIYSEGWSNITGNEFSKNRAGVEISLFSHPEENGYGGYDYNAPVDRFTVDQNNFSENSAGVLLLYTNIYGDDTGQMAIRGNEFTANTVGIDVLFSEAECINNDFTRNGGWAFRLFESATGTSDNTFGACDRVWHQEHLNVCVRERIDDNDQASYNRLSDNATVLVTGRTGEPLFSGRTVNGRPPGFSVDEFEFSGLNITSKLEFARGSIQSTSPVLVEAQKPGKGAANRTVDLETTDSITLYLQPVPDIVVSNFTFPESTAVAGEHLSANFTVLNDDTYDPTGVSMQDVRIDVALDGEPHQTFTVPYLRPGEPQTRDFEWAATPGNHTWTVTADPEGRFRELRTDNNRAELRLDVNGRPVAVIGADRLESLTAEPILFSGAGSRDDGAVAAFLFDFGDGSAAEWGSCATASHSYARPGRFSARLRVSDALGLESDWSAALDIVVTNRPPVLALASVATEVLTLETAGFAVTAADPEGTAVAVAWDFGDGGRISGSGLLSVSHVYAGDGNFTVKVQASDADGGSAEATFQVRVRNRPPVASFAVFPPGGTVLTQFSFLSAASDPDGRVVSYDWDLGDGSPSRSDRPLHTYASPRLYNVSLVVTDDDGAVSEPFTLALRVDNTPPVARARLMQGSPRAGEMLTFDAGGSFDAEGSQLRIEWDFGDGTTGNGTVVRHAFAKAGTYTVKLRVQDGDGAVSEAVIPVTVAEPEAAAGGATGWTTAALFSGALAIAGAALLVAVLRNRPPRGRASPPSRIRQVRPPAGTEDIYSLQLARSRQKQAGRRDRRSLYDQMQPVRERKKDM